MKKTILALALATVSSLSVAKDQPNFTLMGNIGFGGDKDSDLDVTFGATGIKWFSESSHGVYFNLMTGSASDSYDIYSWSEDVTSWRLGWAYAMDQSESIFGTERPFFYLGAGSGKYEVELSDGYDRLKGDETGMGIDFGFGAMLQNGFTLTVGGDWQKVDSESLFYIKTGIGYTF